MVGLRFEESLAWLGGGLKPRVASQTIVGVLEAAWKRLGCVLKAFSRRLGNILDAVWDGLGESFLVLDALSRSLMSYQFASVVKTNCD